MTKRQAEGTVIPDDFGYAKHPELRRWIESEFPRLEPEPTMTRFIEYAQDSGRIATIWTACFKRIVRTGIENGWKGICVFKNGKYDDPRWAPVLADSKNWNCPLDPTNFPTPESFRTQLELWKTTQKKSTLIPFENPLKKFG